MCSYIHLSVINVCFTPCDTFVWQLVAYLATFDLFWISIFGVAVVIVLEIIEFIIKLKEDYDEDIRRNKRRKR